MPGRRWRYALGVTMAAVAALSVDSDESRATTICVPTFEPGCPKEGGNKSAPDVEEAMSLDGSDGKPDTVVIAAGNFAEAGLFEPSGGSPATYEVTGTDPLTVVGAGPGATTLSSFGSGNVYLVNLSFPPNSRHVTLRDLTLEAPASFQDNAGAVVFLEGDTLENVDVKTLNPGTDGVVAYDAGNIFRDGELRGEGPSGSFKFAVQTYGESAALTAEGDRLIGASWAFVVEGKNSSLIARRVAALQTQTVGAGANAGVLTLENSIISLDDGLGLYASPGENPARIDADQVTIADLGDSPTYPALEAKRFGSTKGDGAIEVSNSIVRGFSTGYRAETPFGPGVGTLTIEARYSNLATTGTNLNGIVDFSEGNIDADPVFAPDFSLALSSPSIDAGDPAPGGLTEDFLGAPRPADGNFDGVARRDQGAYELSRPAPRVDRPLPPEEAPDATPPQTKIAAGPGKKLGKGIARFSFGSSEAGSHFECRLDRGKPKPCRSPKRYRRLKAGRHSFSVWAIDAAGNKDPTAAKRGFRVP